LFSALAPANYSDNSIAGERFGEATELRLDPVLASGVPLAETRLRPHFDVEIREANDKRLRRSNPADHGNS
jgi:hypothetical protein